jgi:hypothetical protein
MKNINERALQKMSGRSLAEWLNESRGDEGRQAMAQAIRYMQGSPSKEPPPKDAAMYFAAPLSMFTRIRDGKLDLYPDGDRSYAIFHFWRAYTAGLLGRLRQCPRPRCQKWFYAVRSDRQWCEMHRRITQRAILRERIWRIENYNLKTVEKRIAQYRASQRPLTKAERERLEQAVQRKKGLLAELKTRKDALKKNKATRKGK